MSARKLPRTRLFWIAAAAAAVVIVATVAFALRDRTTTVPFSVFLSDVKAGHSTCTFLSKRDFGFVNLHSSA